MSIIEVRPIEIDRWHGKSSREFPSRPITIEAFVDPSTSKYATGLTDEDKKELESVTGYDLSNDYVAGRAHPFYSTKAGFVKLKDETNIFDTSKPLERIRVGILKDSHLVANSQADYDSGLAPYARFVIYDEREEIQEKAAKSAVIKKVYALSSKLTVGKKAAIVQIALGENVKKQSLDYVEVKFDEALESVGADKMLLLMETDNNRINTHALILEGLTRAILRKEGTSIYYMDEFLAFDMESCVSYFLDKNNQMMKAAILEKINS